MYGRVTTNASNYTLYPLGYYAIVSLYCCGIKAAQTHRCLLSGHAIFAFCANLLLELNFNRIFLSINFKRIKTNNMKSRSTM